jgi:hypothetical protein
MMVRRSGGSSIKQSEPSTEDLLSEWETENYQSWLEYAREQAAKGFCSEDVATDFGLNQTRFRNYLRRKEIRVNWTGKNSPRKISRRNKLYAKYTAFGVEDTLPGLVAKVGEPYGVTYQVLYRRLFIQSHPWSLETALTTARKNPKKKVKQ